MTNWHVGFVVTVCFAFAQGNAQSLDGYKTAGILNGRAWNLMTSEGKTDYLDGLHDGAMVVWPSDSPQLEAEAFNDITKSVGLTYGETIREIDGFYKEAANTRIPVVYAISWIKAKVLGVSKDELELRLTSLRRTMNRKPVTP